MSKVEALKKLTAKIIGGSTTAADIPGNTIVDVILYLTEHYPSTTNTSTGE